MHPTDTQDPDYYHRVVDFQWACPAHTDVPEYIRLIAQGRYSDAYMVNRESNVFPGVLGRVCDRPCEPACRRGRVEAEPVAICRLKRVAADHRDEVRDRLPRAPRQKNGKRIACIGAGPASLTVANDLMPLGYQVTIFEKWHAPGGLMRTNIPAFRLPERVLAEEIGYIVDFSIAGLAVGLRLAGLATRPVGVLVTDILPPSPRSLARRACAVVRRLRRADPSVPPLALGAIDFELATRQLGPGYGAATEAAREAQWVAAQAGLALDTTYSAKCLAEILSRARAGSLPRAPVLFWLTFSSIDVAAAAPAFRAEALPASLRAIAEGGP